MIENKGQHATFEYDGDTIKVTHPLADSDCRKTKEGAEWADKWDNELRFESFTTDEYDKLQEEIDEIKSRPIGKVNWLTLGRK